jgi:hypothetical protein
MKLLKLLLFAFLLSASIQAQVSVNVNFGTPPVWAPTERVASQYYYLPDIDAYYDVPAQRFIYVRNGRWVREQRLPTRYSGYNLRTGQVVFLTDYRGKSPFAYHKKHKIKYKGKRYEAAKGHAKKSHDNGKRKGDNNKGKKDKK